ncbi:ATP-binding cassette domain-containing protein [Phreatobacter stygius]|uniref:ATP-binding cassette domain-containing protein n=1 Tax=Phreatobacter stygius TaxID=1940610 RepID=A0A4D7AZM4_9HYPH|nr:ATP-binding cassette domain-containing protein [Phreatobacter stygius]QCI64223.1 ATP-binding cassette domain-containing protein [Phreatobacter stygius]
MRDTVSILPLTVEGLGFEAGGKQLVADVGFTVPRGGITAILGPNGSGKSLTLRLCHGLLEPSAGRVAWAHPANARHGSAKRHAMVFQKPVMLRRSAEANIVHALAAGGVARRTRQDLARQAMERFGLAALATRPARLLSGGEQQRLAIARAWALKPELMFLDEPSSQLDPGAVRQIEAMLETLAAEGVTLVMATHDLGQARRLAHRVLFFHRGRLIEQGPADAFFASPSTPEARAFIAGELLW